jgi:ketosteroid isomerase-like protein
MPIPGCCGTVGGIPAEPGLQAELERSCWFSFAHIASGKASFCVGALYTWRKLTRMMLLFRGGSSVMKRIVVLLAIGLALTPPLHPQEDSGETKRQACMDACMLEHPNADLQRQEVVALERETARAIQLGDTTFFRRVYSDDFSGVLSRGEAVDKSSFIKAVQTPEIRYESFIASNIKVRLYRDIAVATSVWSIRAVLKGQRVSSQMHALHVYLYTGGGYHVVSGQTTLLPPHLDQPL